MSVTCSAGLVSCGLFDFADPLTKVSDVVASGECANPRHVLVAATGDIYVLTLSSTDNSNSRIGIEKYDGKGSAGTSLSLPAELSRLFDEYESLYLDQAMLVEAPTGGPGLVLPSRAFDATGADGRAVDVFYLAQDGKLSKRLSYAPESAFTGTYAIFTATRRRDGKLALVFSTPINEYPSQGEETNILVLLPDDGSAPSVLRRDYASQTDYKVWTDAGTGGDGHVYTCNYGVIHRYAKDGDLDGSVWVTKEGLPDVWNDNVGPRASQVACDSTGSVFVLVSAVYTGADPYSRQGQYLVKLDEGLDTIVSTLKLSEDPRKYLFLEADTKGFLYLTLKAGGVEKWDSTFF